MRILSSNWFLIVVGIPLWLLAISAVFTLVWNPFYTGDHKVSGQKLSEKNMTSQIDNLVMQGHQLRERQKSLETMVNFCFEHVERPNPIQDLIDKGFVSEEFKNVTCKDIKLQ
jgi:hypothetical protein